MKRLVFGALALLCGCRGPIDLSDAGLPFPCGHLDAGEQCAPGWRCGLEDRCHQIGVVSDYLCDASSDCEGVWQCSLSGRCVDATHDGLFATPAAQTLTAATLPGASGVAAPFVVEGAYPLQDACTGAPELAVTVAWLDGGTLYRENYFPSGKRNPDNPLGGTCPGPIFHRTSASAPFSGGPVVGMASTAGNLLLLTQSGALCTVPASFNSVQVSCTDGGFEGDLALAGHGHLLVAHDGKTLTVIDLTDGGVTRTTLDGGATIEAVALEDALGQPALYVATSAGLFAGTIDPAGHPVVQPTCATNVYRELKLVHPRGDYTQAPALVAVGATIPPNAMPSVLVMAPDPPTKGTCPVPGPLGSTYYVDQGQPCGLQQLMQTPLDVTAGPLDDKSAFLELRLPGGLVEVEAGGSLACKPANTPLPATYAGPVQKPLGTSGEGLANGRGQVWLNRYPLVSDRPFVSAAGGEANLALSYSPMDDEDPAAWSGSFSAGLEARSQSWLHGRVLTGVTGDPRLWITSLGVEDRSDPEDPGLLLSVDTSTLSAPFHATLAGRDAGSLLVMSAFDSLLSAELPGSQPVSRRLAPVPGAPIDSLAFYGEEPGYFAHGYVVATGLLVEIKGRNPLGWTAEPVELAQLAPWRVWIDRGRGRVGATDGTVVTLPSGVQVAQPLPNGEQVLEYQQLCDNTFALSAQALYFLAAPDAGVGQWTAVPAGVPGPYASLYATEHSLLLGSAATGDVTVLSGVQCP